MARKGASVTTMARAITTVTKIIFEEEGRPSGRPLKSDAAPNSREAIIKAAASLIARQGTKNITVRAICGKAGVSTGTFYYFFKDKDALIMSFIMDTPFEGAELSCPLEDIGGRIAELYMLLIRRYISFGRDFVRSFYNPANKVLSAYMGENGGTFAQGSVMARSEQELNDALAAGIITLPDGMTAHKLAAGLCTIVKGCVFEWCLNDEAVDVESMAEWLIRSCMYRYNNHTNEIFSNEGE